MCIYIHQKINQSYRNICRIKSLWTKICMLACSSNKTNYMHTPFVIEPIFMNVSTSQKIGAQAFLKDSWITSFCCLRDNRAPRVWCFSFLNILTCLWFACWVYPQSTKQNSPITPKMWAGDSHDCCLTKKGICMCELHSCDGVPISNLHKRGIRRPPAIISPQSRTNPNAWKKIQHHSIRLFTRCIMNQFFESIP